MTTRKLLCAMALASVLALPGARAMAAPEPDAYLLAPDDVVRVDVANFQSLSCQAVVLPDGTISVPLLGSIAVSGKTTTEVAALLAKKWDEQVVNPLVTVSLTQRRKASILVYGFAVKVGEVPFRPDLRITQVLAEVGGPAANGDLSKVTITHRTGDKVVLDLQRPETLAGSDKDVVMLEGDIVYIPERRTQVTIVGEVNRPGSYDYKDDVTVMDIIGAAGGVRESGDLSAATLQQDGKERSLDLEALLRKGDMSVNVKLKPGDTITVPEIKNRTYIFGAVAKPGYYPFKPGDRILDALNNSGLTQNADLRKVSLIKIDKAKNTAVVEKTNLEDFLKKGTLEANMALAAGDVIFVGDKKRGFGIGDIFSALSGIGLVDNAIRVLTGAPRRY